MTLHELYRQGRVTVGACLGADTAIKVEANTERRRRAAVDALTRARALNIRANGGDWIAAAVPTRTVKKWKEERK